MKKLLAIVLLSICTVASAAEVFIASGAKSQEEWYVFNNTFVKYPNGYSILASKKFPDGRNDVRLYLWVSLDTCKYKYGNMYSREDETAQWSMTTTVAFPGTTVGDQIAEYICSEAPKVFPKTKK